MLYTPACPEGAVEIITAWTPADPPGPRHTRLGLDLHPMFGFLVHYALHVSASTHPRAAARAQESRQLLYRDQNGACCITVGVAARLPHPLLREPAPAPECPYDWSAVRTRWHQILDAVPLRELTGRERACDAVRAGHLLRLKAS